MDIFDLVSDVKRVVERFREQNGEFTLAMLYNKGTIGAGSGWNLILSAPWTDEMGRVRVIEMAVNALGNELPPESSGAISRVTVLKTTDPFVRDMTFLYPVTTPEAGVPVAQVTAGSVTEGSGYIFYAQREVPARQ